MKTYQEFLEKKIAIAKETGFDVEIDSLPLILKPHQKDIVKWAIKGGRRAIFASFGLGKTLMQLTICNEIIKKEDGKALIICPLGIRQEFRNDAEKLLNLNIEYVKNKSEIESSTCDILITNYERVRDGDIDVSYFKVTSLDEASVLRGSSTKTYHSFMAKFENVKYKFVCTATPSPNDYIELINYSSYLGIMDKGQAKTRFFKRDSTKADKLTLFPHKEKEFWAWLSSWAIFINSPSDLGYDAKGYDMPEIKIHYHSLPVDHTQEKTDKYGNPILFRDSAAGLREASKEKRGSIEQRVEKAMEIIKESPEDGFIIWHNLEDERQEINSKLGNGYDVYGSQDMDLREKRILDFSYGRQKYMSTKPEIAGSGCNFQRFCHKAIFVGINYKFNDFIQAIHRIYRFLQEKQVEIHIIHTDNEYRILQVLLQKWEEHKKLVNNMIQIIKENGINTLYAKEMKRTIGCERSELKGKNYTIVNNDCVEEVKTMQDNSVDMILSSFPFSIQYEYSPSYNDFGHNDTNEDFFKQLDFLSPHLLRILKPGRVMALHVKDRIMFGNFTGYGMPSLYPFSDETVSHMRKHGFIYFGRITIVTDVVRENAQTYRLGWSENAKDSTKMGVGMPEYILLFRKLQSDTTNAYADEPVVKSKEEYTRAQWQLDAHGFWRSSGNRLLTPEEIKSLMPKEILQKYREESKKHVYNYEGHVQECIELDQCNKLPTGFMLIQPESWHDDVWTDIVRIKTLNTTQSQKNQNMHVCPLQFDIVDRLINRFTNKNETVFDPFGGLMTIPYRALHLGRKGYAVELSTDYFKDGAMYVKSKEEELSMPTLFDIL